jgi:hypothetical protein
MAGPNPDLPDAMQHYLAMWNELDMDRVRGHLDQAVSDDCVWMDPVNAHIGRDGLEKNVREFRTTFPTAELALASNVDSHNGRYRYEWLIINGDEVVLRGFDVTTLNEDGVINRVDGFFGTLDRFGPDVE